MKKEEDINQIKNNIHDVSSNIEKLKNEMFQSEEYLWNEYEVLIGRLESKRQLLNEKIDGLKCISE